MTVTDVALVVAPHPDDEVLGCAEVLMSRPCAVAHVTDGVPERASRGAEGARMARRRLDESQAAWRLLGARVTERLLLGFEDQQVWRRVPEVTAALTDLLTTCAFSDVYVPAFQNGHPDHDGVYVAGLLARAGLGRGDAVRWWAYGLYGLDRAHVQRFGRLDASYYPDAHSLCDRPEALGRKDRALRRFTSQVRDGSVLHRWLTAPAAESVAALPLSRRSLPSLPCYYEQVLDFAGRFGIAAGAVRAELQGVLAAGGGHPLPGRAR